VESLNLTGKHGGRVSAQGDLNLGGTQAFAVRFDVARFNPARFGAFPQARLNARGQASGALAPDFRVQTRFELPAGELEGHPVVGRGRLNYRGGRLFDSEMDVNLAGNRVLLSGDYQPTRVRANWRIDAPALGRLGRLGLKYLGVELAGQLHSEGMLSGHPARPQITMHARARELRLPGGVAADSLKLDLDMQASASGAFNGELLGDGLALGETTVSSAHVVVQGRRGAHVIDLDARLPEWHVVAQAKGGLDDARLWQGRLLKAELQGAWPLRLLAPASLRLGQEAQRIGEAELAIAGGTVRLGELEHTAGRFATHGSFNQFPLAPLLEKLAAADRLPPIKTDLRLAGEWDVRLDETLNGHVALRRQSGDVTLSDPVMALGLTTLGLEVKADDNRVAARLDIDTARTGRVHAEARTTLTRADGHYVLLHSMPLDWRAQADLPDLRAFRAFLPLGVRADAHLVLDLAGTGTLAEPVLDGTLAASEIRFSMPEEGLAIRDGTIRLKLDDNLISVSEGLLEGQSGRIRLAGTASWRNPTGGLTLNFEEFAALTRSDRRLWLSGTTRLGYAAGRVSLDGDLRADRARLEMPEAARPRLSDDVVVVGREARTVPATRRTPLDLNLHFDLGDDFLFKGAGLDARLGGRLRVFTRNEVLRGEGAIKVEKGRYSAFGQTLDISRGVLTFTGPINNPGIEILAVRETGAVTAGVRVVGTVERPRASLWSDPAMPDTEILSWLLFGHGLDSSDSARIQTMQIMAAALLSQADSVGLQAQLTDALPIDSISLRSGDNAEDLSNTIVSVGRRINSKLMMSYEQSLDGLDQFVKAVYQFSARIRVEATAGSQSSLDVFYTREFD
jgi:translocation and assembly module TamB